MSPEEPQQNYGVGSGICWVDSPTTEVQALITFPACAWIQLSVLADFAPLSSIMKLWNSLVSYNRGFQRHFLLENKTFSVSEYRQKHLMQRFIRAVLVCGGL